MSRDQGFALQRRWQSDTTTVREELNVSRHFNPWTEGPCKPASCPPSFQREREVIEVGWVVRLKQQNWRSQQQAASGWYADVSQGVATYPYGSLRTLCSGSVEFSNLAIIIPAGENIFSRAIHLRSALLASEFFCNPRGPCGNPYCNK